MKMTHYFAADGSYGSADLVIIDTSDWSPDEWDIVENAPEDERMAIAWQLSNSAGTNLAQDPLPGI
jgi:sarcosine oxidase gamma subunit